MEFQTGIYCRGSGWSEDLDQALDSDSTMVVVFGAPSYAASREPIDELRRAFPRAALIGCSTAGEIRGRELFDEALSCGVVRFDHSEVASTSAPIEASRDSFAAGERLAQALCRPDLTSMFVLSDGLAVNGSELVRGINSVVDDSVIVTGGLAGDGDRFESTWVLDRDGPRPGHAVAVGIYGERVRVGHGSRGGWDRFGPERRVTRSVENVLYELDGKPALDLYKNYLGDRASGLPATALLFPLAVREAGNDEKVLVRTVLSVDEDKKSMTFAGDVPKGTLAQLMKGNFERLIEGAHNAACMTRSRVPADSGAFAVAISCVGRRLILGERVEEEIEAAHEVLPARSEMIGFYSYGEISPYASGPCDLHNQTMTLTVISEE